MRKDNYASYVKETMPQLGRSTEPYCLCSALVVACSVERTIDDRDIEAYLCLRIIEAAHGEGEKTGPEERGAGTRRCPQSQSRSRSRRSVRQQSVFRCQGPYPGALRDGAPPSGRRPCHQRSCRSIRSYPADLLQSSERTEGSWARRPTAKPARPQGRPQGLYRGRCLCNRTQNGKTGDDDLAVSRRNQIALRRQGAQAQPGAGAVAQKKRIHPA
jgi:hypothetical protein